MIARLRGASGPLLLGVSAWCALAHVTVLSADSALTRFIAPASLWWLPLLIAGAGCLPGCRRDPWTVTPALLATMSWWPLPLPAVSLVWTGPLAWIAIGLAVWSAAAASGWRAVPETPRPWDSPRTASVIAGMLTLALSLAVAWSLSPRLPGGDEPHYLIITQSLLGDGDLRIDNNHRDRDYAAYWGGDLAPDFIQKGQHGEIYSIHAPGLSVVVLPAFALFGYRGAQAVVIILAALTGAVVWYTAWLAARDRIAAWFAWAAVIGSTTFLIQSVSIFPDGPGSLASGLAVLALLVVGRGDGTRPRRFGMTGLLAVATPLALLPWLHTRFVVLAAGFGLLISWHLIAEPAITRRQRWTRVLAFLAIPAVSALLWFGFFQILYGTFNPAAPYGHTPTPDPEPETSLSYAPGGMLALLFDEQFGLLTYSPILAVAGVGLWMRRRGGNRPGLLVGAAAIGMIYLAVTATYWMFWGGVPATPARFATVILPVFAPPIALAWNRSGSIMRAMWSLLLAISVGITALVIGVDHGALAWNIRGEHAEWLRVLGPVVDLSRGWPSFFWRLTPKQPLTEASFAIHAGVWVLAFVLPGFAVLSFCRRRAVAGGRAVLAAAVWLAVSLTSGVQCGWWIDGVTGLAPVRSQMSLLRRVGSGAAPLAISPLSIRVATAGTSQLRIDAQRSGGPEAPTAAWEPLIGVPPGTYSLTVTTKRPTGGTLSVRIGRSRTPWRTWPLAPASAQTMSLPLPGGAEVLVFEPDVQLAASGQRIELGPIAVAPNPAGAARSQMSLAIDDPSRRVDLFFLDDHAYVEDDGFWVKGNQTAEVMVSAVKADLALSLQLANGSKMNTVAIESAAGAFHTSVTLDPFATRAVTLPSSRDPTGGQLFRISSSAGFRPSEGGSGSSSDARYLGVRVTVVAGR